jgi:hypothetical protein
VNSKLVASGAYTGTIPAGHTLVIDSTTIPYSIIEYDSADRVVADRYPLCDFSTKRFFMLQAGSNSIAISHDGTNDVGLKVEAQFRYESV